MTEMPKTIVESGMVVPFVYGQGLSKEDLIETVGQVFPGAVKKEEQIAAAKSEGLPPGVSIDAGNFNFFVASDKCVVKFRGMPIADAFLEVAVEHLEKWMAIRNPESIQNVSYRETFRMPTILTERLYPLMDGAVRVEDSSHVVCFYQNENAFVDIERRINRGQGTEALRELFRVTATSAKNPISAKVYKDELKMLRSLVRQIYEKETHMRESRRNEP